MSLSIQNDAGAEGGGDTINPAVVQINLGTITNDMNIGQGVTTGDLIQVTYAGTAASAPATRISTLVNTNFGVNPGNPDIIILGTGPNFTALDGSVLCGNGFTARPMTPDNPTASIYIVYDTTNGNGGGIQVRAPGGGAGTFTSPTPGPVVLYHELSHALRMANNTAQADDEVPAINDENILRPLLNPPIALRDPNPPHDGQASSCSGPPGSGGCCVVATVSTGSAYSEEVSALRGIRDRVLRKSDIGFDFFDRLHYDYYAVSPEICRMMARSHELQESIRLNFVGPLAKILHLANLYNSEGAGDAETGQAFEAGVVGSELAELDEAEIAEALEFLSMRNSPGTALLTDGHPLAGLSETALHLTPLLEWALLDPVEIYAKGLLLRLQGVSRTEIGRRLTGGLDAWAARMPLTEVWTELSTLGLERELEFLGRVMVRNAGARLELGQRLAMLFDSDEERLAILRVTGFLADGKEGVS